MLDKTFLGVAYYPEDWDECEIDKDIAKMKEVGISVVRIAEFAWSKMEPVEGQFDFSFFHRVVDKLAENGIKVILGTPTATPPVWLWKKHPDIMVVDEYGRRRDFGGRRDCCSNNPDYLKYCDIIVEKMAQEFGDDKNVIGWQLDNEIYMVGNFGCTCKFCTGRFQKHLKEKYKTIENLNKQWENNIFSRNYEEFCDFQPPINTWHSPHLLYEWNISQFDAHKDFLHRQADIIRKYSDEPIGTDMMPTVELDYEKTTEKLDVVMFNHYNTVENLNDTTFWYDYLRNIKDKPFIVTETSTTWNGGISITQVMKPEGFCRLNSELPVIFGGKGNMYWLWRQHHAGHELMHGSVISAQGKFLHTKNEVIDTNSFFKTIDEICKNNTVDTEIALLFTSKNRHLFKQERIIDGFDYVPEMVKYHKAITSCGVRPDVIGAHKNLDKYKLIFAPYMMTLEDNNLQERLKKWIADGGILVIGPMSDIRNEIGAHYIDNATGMIEEITGATLENSIPTDGSVLKLEWNNGDEIDSRLWAECYSCKGKSLAKVKSGHSALNGKNITSEFNYGNGKIIVCGAIMGHDDNKKLVRIALNEANIKGYEISDNIQVVPREGYIFISETEYKCGYITLDRDMTDILSGKILHKGKNDILPYSVFILK